MKKLFMLLLVAGFLAGNAHRAQAAMVPVDFVYVIDYSGTMGADINEVINNIATFNSALANAGFDARYGAVQFGQFANGGNPILLTDLTDSANLSAALTGALPAGGGFEPGSLATVFALNNISFRANAAKNVILITDEDDDSTAAEFAAADASLTQAGALFNVIGNPGFGNTDIRYSALAADHGGSIFNILDFRADPAAFLTHFNNTKIFELIAAPEPSLALLIGTGLVAIGFPFRRRRSAIPVVTNCG